MANRHHLFDGAGLFVVLASWITPGTASTVASLFAAGWYATQFVQSGAPKQLIAWLKRKLRIK